MSQGDCMAAKMCTDHIKKCLTSFKGRRPLVVGMQGPQGSGKTTACSRIQKTLGEEGCSTAILSIDGELIRYNFLCSDS